MPSFTYSWWRRVTLMLLLGLPSMTAWAQPAPTWGAAWGGGGAGALYAYATAADASGNVFVGGRFTGNNVAFGAFPLSTPPTPATTSTANSNSYLVKYSPTGTVLWARQTTNLGFSDFIGLATDAAGNVYGTGIFTGGALTLGSITLTSTSLNSQGFVVKYDAQGTVQWARLLGSTFTAVGYALAATPGGTVYVSGYSAGTLSVGTLPTLSSTGPNDLDAFLVKYDAQGTAQWARQTSGSGNDYGYGVAVDGAGNPALAGTFASPTLTTGSTALTNGSANAFSNDIFLVRYDAQGTPQWAQRAGGAGSDRCNALAATATGDVYLVGFLDAAGGTAGGTTFGTNSGGGALVAAYSPQGVGRWARREDAGSSYSGVATDASNNVLVTGTMSNTLTLGAQTLTSAGGSDLLLARYSASGALLGASREGGTNNETGVALCATPANGLVVVGSTESSSLTVGSTSLPSSGGTRDVLVVAYGATGNVSFARRLSSGGGQDAVSAVVVDAQGNTYVAGTFANNTRLGSVSLAAARQEVFVAKYSPAGTVLWARQLSSPLPVQTGGLALDAAGNAYVAGAFVGTLSTGTSFLSSAGGSNDTDAFLLKYDPQGTVLWARSAGGGSFDAVRDVAVSAAGEVTIAGNSASATASFGGYTVPGVSGSIGTIFLARYDAAGTAQWARSFQPASPGANSYVLGLAVDGQGNSGLTGYFFGSIGFGPTVLTSGQLTQNTAFVAKCDPTGNILWARQAQHPTATATASSYSYGIAFDPTGNAVITGFCYEATAFGPTTLVPTGFYGQFLTKYDAAGTVQWARQSSGTGSTIGYAVTADAAGHFYLAGAYVGPTTFGPLTLPTSNSTTGYLIRYDGLGNPVWVANATPNTGGVSTVRALAPGPNHSLSVVGTYTNFVQFTPRPNLVASESPGNDFFVARLEGATLLTSRPALAATPADLYPNPAHEAATLRLPAPFSHPEPVRILDPLGREVRRQAVPAQARQVALNLTGLAAGLYIVRCGTTSQQLVVE